MPERADDSIQTRPSLLRRVKDWRDQESWREFYDTYKRIVFALAIKSGLTEAEADDIVQDTFLEVAQKMPKFEYDPARGSFKGWLLKLTRWRVRDYLRKRQRTPDAASSRPEDGSGRRLLEAIPNPTEADLDAIWEKEWEAGLMEAALEKVRGKTDPEKFQIFDLYVQKEWAPEKVASTLGITLNQVYLAKHRVTELLRTEVKRLETKIG
jgi:RNA polymerase sigma factor (sigma-70 family)